MSREVNATSPHLAEEESEMPLSISLKPEFLSTGYQLWSFVNAYQTLHEGYLLGEYCGIVTNSRPPLYHSATTQFAVVNVNDVVV